MHAHTYAHTYTYSHTHTHMLTHSHTHTHASSHHHTHTHTLVGEEGEGMVQYLLASHTNQLLVFQDASLVWAARVDQTPADIAVAHFQ